MVGRKFETKLNIYLSESLLLMRTFDRYKDFHKPVKTFEAKLRKIQSMHVHMNTTRDPRPTFARIPQANYAARVPGTASIYDPVAYYPYIVHS